MGTTLRNTKVIRFSPKGLSDTLDSTESFPGACAVLQNLIPDPSTEDLWTCRPASMQVTAFGGYVNPGFISVFKVIGSFVFGLISSNRNVGFDEPFCYNLVTNQFVTVANITSSNVPSSPLSTGDWTPPTMALVGSLLIVTHPGFGIGGTWDSGTWDTSTWGGGGANAAFGWFDISTSGRPSWHAGNLQNGGSIQSISVTAAGSGYANGTYTQVPLTGGTGSGATVDVIVSSNGVSIIYLDTWGKGYVVNDVLSAANSNLGGSGSGFQATVNAVALNGNIQFSTPPAWVAQFFERAYFGVNPPNGTPSVVYTDVMALNCTNANQALTFDSNLPLVAGHGLGLSNQLGGVVQSLMVFQDDENVIQITGDAALNTLSVNSLNTAVGTASPRSIVSTPQGIMFLAYDGFRLINFDAVISDPIGEGGTGVVVPFEQALNPSRINASCNGGVLRVSVIRGDIIAHPWQEFWYDLKRKVWSGPHTFPSSMSDIYGAGFIQAPANIQSRLFSGAVIPTASSTYTENGIALSFILQSSTFPDDNEMSRYDLAEMRIVSSIVSATDTFNVIIQDQSGTVINQATFTTTNANPNGGVYPWRIDFPSPVVFTRAAIQINGASSFGEQFGDIQLRVRDLGYIDNFFVPLPVVPAVGITLAQLISVTGIALFLNGGVIMIPGGVTYFQSTLPHLSGIPWNNGQVLMLSGLPLSGTSPSWVSLIAASLPATHGLIYQNGLVLMVS